MMGEVPDRTKRKATVFIWRALKDIECQAFSFFFKITKKDHKSRVWKLWSTYSWTLSSSGHEQKKTVRKVYIRAKVDFKN